MKESGILGVYQGRKIFNFKDVGEFNELYNRDNDADIILIGLGDVSVEDFCKNVISTVELTNIKRADKKEDGIIDFIVDKKGTKKTKEQLDEWFLKLYLKGVDTRLENYVCSVVGATIKTDENRELVAVSKIVEKTMTTNENGIDFKFETNKIDNISLFDMVSFVNEKCREVYKDLSKARVFTKIDIMDKSISIAIRI